MLHRRGQQCRFVAWLAATTMLIQVFAATACLAAATDAAHLFDRFVGTWDCDFGFISEDGSVRHTSGEVRFGSILDGRAVQDIWITYPKTGSTGERRIGTSIRFFDPGTGAWRVVFVAPAFGLVNTLEGGAEGDRVVLRGQDSDGSSMRWSFNDIRANSFLWRGESSHDGGKNWRLEEEHHMTRRQATESDPRREMITELQAPGPHASLGDEAKLFNRFVGSWDCEFAEFATDGKVNRFSGEVRFGWIIDGWALQDVWTWDEPSKDGKSSERAMGTSVRFFDSKSKQWRVIWVAPSSNRIVQLQGGAEGDRIVLNGHDDDGTLRRWSFNDIGEKSFIWRGEVSSSDGKNWRLAAEYHMKRRQIASSR